MQALPLAGEQLAQDDLADELMTERVGDRRVHGVRVALVRVLDGHEDPALDRLAERVPDLARRPLHDRGEEIVVHEPPGRGCSAQHLPGRSREPSHAGEEDIAEAWRQVERARIVRFGATRTRSVGERRFTPGMKELLDEERVAVRPFHQGVDEVVVRCSADRPLHEGADIAPPEWPELDALHPFHPLELGQMGQQGLSIADLVAPDRGDDEDRAFADDPGEVGQQVERGAVRPLEVFDHEHERSLAGDPLERVEDRLEQLRPGTAPRIETMGIGSGRPIEFGDEPRQAAPAGSEQRGQLPRRDATDELAQRGDERRERESAVADAQARAGQDTGAAGPRATGELLDEAGLADAGLAADEDDRRCAGDGPGEARLEPLELHGPTDECGCRSSIDHAPIIPARSARLSPTGSGVRLGPRPSGGDVGERERPSKPRPGATKQRPRGGLRACQGPGDLRAAVPLRGHDDGRTIRLGERGEGIADERVAFAPEHLVLGRSADAPVVQGRGISIDDLVVARPAHGQVRGDPVEPAADVVGVRPALASRVSRRNASWAMSSAADGSRVSDVRYALSAGPCSVQAASTILVAAMPNGS